MGKRSGPSCIVTILFNVLLYMTYIMYTTAVPRKWVRKSNIFILHIFDVKRYKCVSLFFFFFPWLLVERQKRIEQKKKYQQINNRAYVIHGVDFRWRLIIIIAVVYAIHARKKKKHKSSTNCLRADRDVCASAATFWNRWYVHCGCIVCARWRPIFEIIIIIIICNIAVTRVRDKEASQAPPLRISFLPRAPPRTSTTIMNISDTCVPLVHRTLTSI